MVRLTLAFASASHATTALRFIEGAAIEFAQSSPIDPGPDGGFAHVDVTLAACDRGRLLTLVDGVHGLVVAESTDELLPSA